MQWSSVLISLLGWAVVAAAAESRARRLFEPRHHRQTAARVQRGNHRRLVEHYLRRRVEDAFTVRLSSGCTGSIVAEDWVLTAAHCVDQFKGYETNRFGDHELDVSRHKTGITRVNKHKASRLSQHELWAAPLGGDPEPSRLDNSEKGWRRVRRIIWHANFTTEALSWKGFDVALIQLQRGFYGERAAGAVAPACLASADYDVSQHLDETFFAGYGRRFIPFCMTDDRGPETFAVCGRPKNCFSRTDFCGVDFLYNGRRHDRCLTDVDTPSAHDPVCKTLRRHEPTHRDGSTKTHVFQRLRHRGGGLRHLTTCYPTRAGGRGWCATRRPGVDEDEEPRYDAGWGFCSDDHAQDFCTESVPTGANSTAFPVSILTSDYCVRELGANLAVEQPDVTRGEYERVEERYGVICVGRNHSKHFDRDAFLEWDPDEKEFRRLRPDDRLVGLLLRNTTDSKPFAIDGRICFGDSGGPLFQLAYDHERGVVKPVIIAVFSFILWGTCHGQNEPAYFDKLQYIEGWLRQYLGDSPCWAGRETGGRRSKRTSVP